MINRGISGALAESYLELRARQRALRLLDEGTSCEVFGPFDGIVSTWLTRQQIVPQFDDGVVVLLGSLDGAAAMVVAIEGAFQGGSIGEVSGTKILCALELTRRDIERGRRRIPVLLLESGGVRLQEANLGLELISEIHAEIVALRRLVPVICVVSGMVGCFGGMSIAACLCSCILMTPQGRLGLNGPEVIEQEAGLMELDASDRQFVWGLMGGRQRVATGFADELLPDDIAAIRKAVIERSHRGGDGPPRSERIDHYLSLLESEAAASVWTPDDVRSLLAGEASQGTDRGTHR